MKNILEYLIQDVELYPNKKAIGYKDEFYTYEQLNNLSSQLGYKIKDTFSFENRPIGVIATQSINTLMYFFAVLYSGNYYVPIDPDMPKEKIKMILDDANIDLVLCDSEQNLILEEIKYIGKSLSINEIGDKKAEIPNISDETPIYMVYTSGSTGKPKGVLKSHKAVFDFIEAYVNTFDFNSDEVIGNQTPFFFDASAKDIYLMLKLGCTLEILPSTLFSLPPELIDYLNEKKVTFASWVPTVLSIVAQLNPFSMVKPTTLKKVFFVGEVMQVKHLNKWIDNLPNIQYVNLYGQSELSGICCYYEVKKKFENNETLPIGKALSNSRVYLINDGKIITEPETTGEIYVVSKALAIEYFNDKEKTDCTFVEFDFGNGKERCLKTGDLAKYDNDGNLVFATRSDYQIKHMGHRIELGEIETIANQVEEIFKCCCVFLAEKRKLILFCELSEGVEKTAQEIRSILRNKLSSYMLPNKVIVLDQLPINSNGKIDRQNLLQQAKK